MTTPKKQRPPSPYIQRIMSKLVAGRRAQGWKMDNYDENGRPKTTEPKEENPKKKVESKFVDRVINILIEARYEKNMSVADKIKIRNQRAGKTGEERGAEHEAQHGSAAQGKIFPEKEFRGIRGLRRRTKQMKSSGPVGQGEKQTPRQMDARKAAIKKRLAGGR